MSQNALPAHVAVVGSGLAGLRTATALRTHGYPGSITLLGSDGVRPYDRPPLSKELLSRTEPLWLETELDVDLAEAVTDVRLHDPAIQFSADELRLGLASGATLTPDAVVLACGSAPINPWPESALVLHTAADADALRARLAPGVRLAIVGAGWIGAEVAGVAAEAGVQVQVLESADEPLARQLPAELGVRIRPWYAQAGVELRTGNAVSAVTADGVELADGQLLAADVVLTAVGVRPDTGWLSEAVPLTPSGHVPTDTTGRTQVPGVWAVGDCAHRDHPTFGAVPGGHWSAALHDPDTLARAMLGLDHAGAQPAPFIYSTQLGHHLSVFGRLDGELLLREQAGGAGWTALVLDEDVLVGAVVADQPREVSAVRKLLGSAALPRLDLQLAADPGVNLRKAVLR